jgi:hypothetical protein
MNSKALFVYALSLLTCHFTLAQSASFTSFQLSAENTTGITLEVQVIANRSLDSIQVQFAPINAIGIQEWDSHKQKLSAGKAKWKYDISEPAYLIIPFLPRSYSSWLAEPGDSVTVVTDCTNL